MARQFDEDEDFDTKPKGKGRKAEEEDPKVKAGATTKRTIENEADLDCDWDDQTLMRKKDPMPRVRPEKNGAKAVRFAILPFVKPKRAYSHYVDKGEKKGTFRCLSSEDNPEGVCCTSGQIQQSQLAIVALVVKYSNVDPKSGKYEGKYKTADTEWELGHVSLSRSNYTQINKLVEDEEGEGGKQETVYDFDIIMTHNEASGIGYTLTRASRTPRWRKDPEVAAAVEAAAAPFVDGKLLTSRLGRKLTPIEWKALLSGLTGEVEDESGDDGEL